MYWCADKIYRKLFNAILTVDPTHCEAADDGMERIDAVGHQSVHGYMADAMPHLRVLLGDDAGYFKRLRNVQHKSGYSKDENVWTAFPRTLILQLYNI